MSNQDSSAVWDPRALIYIFSPSIYFFLKIRVPLEELEWGKSSQRRWIIEIHADEAVKYLN